MRHWIDKFRYAGRGLLSGMHRQSSFAVHFVVSVLVVGGASVLRCELWQWCVLGLCIALVVGLEYMNSAVERLAKGLCKEHNPDIGAALDISSAAVLFASLVAALIGSAIFINQAWCLFATN